MRDAEQSGLSVSESPTSVLRMLPSLLIRHRRLLVGMTHAGLVLLAYRAAFELRFDGAVPATVSTVFWETSLALIIIRLASFAATGLDRGFWCHVGQRDLITLVKAVILGTVVFALVLLSLHSLGPVPRSVVVMEAMITLLLTGGVRFAARALREGRPSWWRPLAEGRSGDDGRGASHPGPASIARRADATKRVLVVGAGAAGERLLRQLAHDTDRSFQPVALVDDDPHKQGMQLHGVRVVGTIDQLEEIITRCRVQLVVVAISRATPVELRRILEPCVRLRVECKRLPSMREMLEGNAEHGRFADIRLEQLLVRPPITFDSAAVARDLAGSVVLITGGAGSVGSELARQIARVRPARLVLVEQAESPLYYVHLELQRAFPGVETIPIIGDVTDRNAMTRIFGRYRPDHVYHAAAYKHVPMMEANAAEAVRNNVLGTLHAAECAARVGARKFVLISTDKAVRPTSIMGATKRVAERIVLAWPSLSLADTEFRVVRFGNVLGSEGSVVPLFQRQLAAGGPITVTHPDVRRYFMTLPEAAQLVLQAAALPEAAGHIAILDMGEPIRILDLAENLIRLSGLEPYRDVQIVFTGLRPGEKLHEELMTAAEVTVPSSAEKIRIVQTDEVDGAAIQSGVARLVAAALCDEPEAMREALGELVPEYTEPRRRAATTRAVPRERPAADAERVRSIVR